MCGCPSRARISHLPIGGGVLVVRDDSRRVKVVVIVELVLTINDRSSAETSPDRVGARRFDVRNIIIYNIIRCRRFSAGVRWQCRHPRIAHNNRYSIP